MGRKAKKKNTAVVKGPGSIHLRGQRTRSAIKMCGHTLPGNRVETSSNFPLNNVVVYHVHPRSSARCPCPPPSLYPSVRLPRRFLTCRRLEVAPCRFSCASFYFYYCFYYCACPPKMFSMMINHKHSSNTAGVDPFLCCCFCCCGLLYYYYDACLPIT